MRAIQEQAEHYLHQCFSIAMYEPYIEVCRRICALHPGAFAEEGAARQLGRRGRRERGQDRPLRDRPRRPSSRFEQAFHGRTLLAHHAHLEGHAVQEGLRPVRARGLPRAGAVPVPRHRHGRGAGARCASCSRARSTRRRSPRSSTSRCRARAASCPATAGLRRGADRDLPASTASSTSTTRCRPACAAPARCWPSSRSGVEPDLIVWGKSLGGGLPLAGVTGRAELMDAPHVGGLGGTFGGNPLSCAAALRRARPGRSIRPSWRAPARSASTSDAPARRRSQERAPTLIGEVRGHRPDDRHRARRRTATRRSPRRPQAGARRASSRASAACMLMGAGIYSNVVRILVPLVATRRGSARRASTSSTAASPRSDDAGGGGGAGHRRPAGTRRTPHRAAGASRCGACGVPARRCSPAWRRGRAAACRSCRGSRPTPRPDRRADLVELAGDDAGPLIAAGRLAVIEERSVNGLGDVPGPAARRRARPERRAARRAVPVEPAAAAGAPLGVRRAAADEPALALRSPRGGARGPARLAARAGRGRSLPRHRRPLRARRATSSPRRVETLAPARPLLHLYPDAATLRSLFRRGVIDLALGNPSTLGDQRANVVAVLPSEGTIASERVLGIVSGTRRAICARRVAGALLRTGCTGPAGRRPGPRAGAGATCAVLTEGACKTLQRALSRTLASSAVAVRPVAAAGVTGWPEWVGEWVLLQG